jgi:anti-sigma B factor antagonist
MKVESEDRGIHAVVRLKGTISVGETTQSMSEIFSRLEKEKTGAVVADLTFVKSLDSTALGLLVGALRRLRGLSRDLILVGPSESVSMLLSMTQLDTIFTIRRTVAEALQALPSTPGGASSS